MAGLEIAADLREVLAQPNPAVMATLAADGRPVTVATWYLLEADGTVLLNLDATRAWLRHIRRDPRISLTAFAGDNWYAHISLIGQAVSVATDDDLSDIDRLSRHYTGGRYHDRHSPRVSVSMQIERWHRWAARTVLRAAE